MVSAMVSLLCDMILANNGHLQLILLNGVTVIYFDLLVFTVLLGLAMRILSVCQTSEL